MRDCMCVKKSKMQEIFQLGFPKYMEKYGNRTRKVCIEEVKKMSRCKDETYGHTIYRCPECEEELRVPFTCKSRLCTSCGKIRTDEWEEGVRETILDVPHRHITFTIPEELRELFRKDRKLLKELSDIAAKLVLEHFGKQRKKTTWVPGIITGIHTFGRDLKWNPHIHMLVTEGAMDDNGRWHEVKFIKYEILRNSWRYLVLQMVQKKYKGDRRVKKIVDEIYKETINGFYVHNRAGLMMAVSVARYIGRYISRPAIAESRIIRYDKEYVVFSYERHEDGEYVEELIEIEEFIGKVLIHVPDRQFKLVRYYGLYSRRSKRRVRKIMKEVKKLLNRMRNKMSYEERLKKSFDVEITRCPKCGCRMEVYDIYYYKCGSLLKRLVEQEYRRIKKEEAA